MSHSSNWQDYEIDSFTVIQRITSRWLSNIGGRYQYVTRGTPDFITRNGCQIITLLSIRSYEPRGILIRDITVHWTLSSHTLTKISCLFRCPISTLPFNNHHTVPGRRAWPPPWMARVCIMTPLSAVLALPTCLSLTCFIIASLTLQNLWFTVPQQNVVHVHCQYTFWSRDSNRRINFSSVMFVRYMTIGVFTHDMQPAANSYLLYIMCRYLPRMAQNDCAKALKPIQH